MKEWEYLIDDDRRVTWNSSFPDNELDSSEYGLAFFYSPYYTAEDDNLEVCLKGGYTIGWLITLPYLQEKDKDFIDQHKSWLNKFASIGIPSLLAHIVEEEPELLEYQDNECSLSDIDIPACHVFVYRISQICKDDIYKFLPGFYDEGFYHVNKLSDARNESLFYKSSYEDNLIKDDKKKKINLSKIEYSDDLIKLIRNLYEKWLPYSYVNPFSRYIYLYQVVEYFMEIAFEESLFVHINDFNNKNINKNDLRIKLEKDSEEITKIGLVFNAISPSNSVAIDFNNNVDNFLGKIGVEFSGKTIGSHVYKIRNVLVHNMRLAVDYENELNDVVECFEKLIAIRLNKGMSDNHNKHMVVCDTSERYKKNKKRMKKTYVQYKYGK